jgi:hypothetical protein
MASVRTKAASQHRVAAPRDGSKLALVIEFLRRADGATIVDLTQSTEWLPHTTRVALTGLRKVAQVFARMPSHLSRSLSPRNGSFTSKPVKLIEF